MVENRSYTEATKSALFAISAKCYFPQCSQPSVTFFEETPKKNVQIAHIRAISVNGPRYNPPGYPILDKKARNDFSNLILLCDFHHGIVDKKANEISYPVDLLVKWKSAAEKDMRSKIDGLDRLTEDRLDEMLITAARETRKGIERALRELASISVGASEVLSSLYEKIESHYLDVESIALLDSASRRLSYLEEGASLLYSASTKFEELESSSFKLVQASENLEEFSPIVYRLEQVLEDYNNLVNRISDLPDYPDISPMVEHSSAILLSRIDEKVASIDIGEPSIIVNDGQRWKYAAWGFVAGVLAVMVTVIILSSTGKI